LKLVADLSSEEQVEGAIQKTVAAFGRLDYAVNNAAIASPFKVTHESTTADFDKVLGINLRGTWFCERAELRQMLKQEPLDISGSL
jgi:NAD(P)-dependent dehydrogenase (short-subunit alcohol dehydrogenase family)